MAKPLLLLLHGIGSHSSGWADHAIARLGEIAATFPDIAGGGPLASQVVLKPLRYDSVFDDQLKRWRDAGKAMKGFTKDTTIKVPKLASFLDSNLVPPDEESFVWNAVMDAVTYRGVTPTRGEIRTHVMKEIVSAVNAHLDKEPGAEVSILGHSLGTIVTHDVLHLLATGQGGAAFRAEFVRFANVFLVANASRLGPKKFIDIKSDDSRTRPVGAPKPTDGGDPYCGAFYNINNHWDPIGSWARFAPQGWGDRFHDIEVRHIHQVNVHGIDHYIEHPSVHIPLFRALLGHFVIPERLKEQREMAFPDLKPTTCGTAVATLMNELDRIRTAANGGNLDDVAMGMVSMYRAVRQAKNSCQEMFNVADGVL
jgi:hypothetical protein